MSALCPHECLVSVCDCVCTSVCLIEGQAMEGAVGDLQSRCPWRGRPPHPRPGWRALRPGWWFLLRQRQRLGKPPPWGQVDTGVLEWGSGQHPAAAVPARLLPSHQEIITETKDSASQIKQTPTPKYLSGGGGLPTR